MYRFLSSQKSPGTPAPGAHAHFVARRQGSFANLTRRRRPSSASLLVRGSALSLAFLDLSTIVNIAYQRSSVYDIGSLSTVLNDYSIVFVPFMVAAGRLADLLGRRRTFLPGVCWCSRASGDAPSPAVSAVRWRFQFAEASGCDTVFFARTGR